METLPRPGGGAVPAWDRELLNGASLEPPRGDAPAWLCLRLLRAQQRAPPLSQNRTVFSAEYSALEGTRRDHRGLLWRFERGLSGSPRAPSHHFEIGAAGEALARPQLGWFPAGLGCARGRCEDCGLSPGDFPS